MSILIIWLIAIIIVAVLWRLLIKGRIINWYGLFLAILGAIADIACQLRIDIAASLKRRKKAKVIPMDETVHLDECERSLS